MSNRTERDQGFGPIEMRTGHADFPGWRGLQRTGDTVLKPGRFYRAWNCQLNDGDVSSRGGQSAFADLGSDESRPQCITSIIGTNDDWGDLGQKVELRFAGGGGATYFDTQSDTEPDPIEIPRNYRGDVGAYASAPLASTTNRRQLWVRDGVDNTSSGIETAATVNTTVRVGDRVYFANLDGSVTYITPGSVTPTTIAATGVEFASGSHPMAISYNGRLIVIGAGVAKEWSGTAWSSALTTVPAGFIAVGWTLFDVDSCIYVFGRDGNNAVVLKISTALVITTVYTAVNTDPSWNWNRPIDIASNNDMLVISYMDSISITELLRCYTSANGTAWTITAPIPDPGAPGADGGFGPTRMLVAGEMIWSIGYQGESLESSVPLLFSYDGTEWLIVIADAYDWPTTFFVGLVDIVQIEPDSALISDSTEL